MMLRRLFPFVVLLAIEVFAGLPPGRPLPDVSIPSATGRNKIDLKHFRGKPLILAIVSADCKECEEATVLLKKVKEDNKAQGLEVLAIVVQKDADSKAASFAAQLKPNFPVGYLVDLVPYRKILGIDEKKNVAAPALLFIDAAGLVRVQLYGDDSLMKKPDLIVRSTVRELLKETPNK